MTRGLLKLVLYLKYTQKETSVSIFTHLLIDFLLVIIPRPINTKYQKYKFLPIESAIIYEVPYAKSNNRVNKDSICLRPGHIPGDPLVYFQYNHTLSPCHILTYYST